MERGEAADVRRSPLESKYSKRNPVSDLSALYRRYGPLIG
jgi:hypothetical protein